MLLFAGCEANKLVPPDESKKTATAPSSSAPTFEFGAPSGIPQCDAFFTTAQACLEKLPAAERKLMLVSLQQYQKQATEAGSEASKQAVAIGCETELGALKDDPRCAMSGIERDDERPASR